MMWVSKVVEFVVTLRVIDRPGEEPVVREEGD